ncbi:MAG: sigma-70 family RNA polymerase sigma factor, partial [Deltaproteobacteria bacterium]|nr:sigma-70 family RNA polymerase sigma factor [Deltaproteobacteria bacterium]
GTGLVGVAEAATCYDPARGVPFLVVATIHARGRMLDLLRREWRGPRGVAAGDSWGEQILVSAGAGAAPPPTPVPSIESVLTRREAVVALRRALSGLPAREREALRAVLLEGRESGEVARSMGVTRRAVNLMCARAKKRLRGRLRALGQEPAAALG